MYQINNEKFGRFIAQLRKGKNLTQKELADKLYVSDKTVSKWERGLSFPGISLLIPLAEVLDVTVTELLKGEILQDNRLDIQEIESLVTCSVDMSVKEQSMFRKRNQKWTRLYVLCTLLAIGEILFFIRSGLPILEQGETVFLLEGMMILFGGWFCLFAKEKLPAYYDENRISFVSDGIFRINLAGLHFHNGNWPHILNAGRIWCLCVSVLYPALFFLLNQILSSDTWIDAERFLTLPVTLGMLLLFYLVGKKYD